MANLIDMSSEEEVSQQIFGSSSSIMPETPQKKERKQKPKKNTRRLALTSDDIAEIKILAATTLQKKRTTLQTQEDSQAKRRTLEIPSKGSIRGITITIPKMGEKEWTRNKILWTSYMEQVMTYYVINQTIFTPKEIETIKEGVYKYMAWHAIDIYEEVDTKLERPITISMPAPFYNPAKGIPWLFREWPQIEQYLHLGRMREIITDETAMTLDEQQIEELEQAIQQAREQESEDPEEIEAAAFKQKKLKKDLAKKNKELRDKLGLGTTKSKKGVQFGDLLKGGEKKDNPDKSKGKGKKAEKDQSTSGGDDPGDSSSSSSESSSGKESSSENESEDNTREVRQLSPSHKEWEQITGKKTPAKEINKMSKNTSLVKLPPPEMFDGTNKKWRNPTTFDQYTARMAEWLTYQKLDIQKEEALSRFS